jgi:hypothetical protein
MCERPLSSRRRARWAVQVALSLLASHARAGNDDGILVGGQAALVGGAVTATANDGAAAWYNPAGLAQVERHSFDINASAYGISAQHASNLFTLPDGQTSDAQVTDWQLVPSAISYTRVLGRVVGSFGIFIPSTTDADLRASLRQADGTRWTFGIDDVRNEYNYIASLGFKLSEALRVGVALHGIYVSSETMLQIASGTPGISAQPFLSVSLHEARADYGLRVGLGVQWTATPKLALGLALQTPTLTGFRRIDSDTASGSYGGGAQGGFESVHTSALRQPWDISTPLHVRMGAAYTLGRAQLSLDGSYSSRLNTEGTSFDRRDNVNVRVGALYTQSERLSYGAGLFSDRNGFREAAPSFVGVAGGVRMASDFTISEGQRRLTFVTTLAGRYAYGWGHVDGIEFVSITETRSTRAPMQVHELAFNLGSAVTF